MRLLICISLLFVGCGPGSDTPDDDGGLTPDGDAANVDTSMAPDGGRSDMAPDDIPDMGAADTEPTDLGPSIYPVLDEEEPNTQRSEATAFTAPATLVGSIDRQSDAVDWWELHLPGPSLLEVTIEGGDIGWVELQTTNVSKRGIHGGPGTVREFFIPAADRYQLGIVSTEEKPSLDYRITVRSIEATAQPLTELTASGDLDDGKVDVYSWISQGEGFTIAEVFGEREPVASGIDPFLFVQDQTLGTFESNDDAMSGGTRDSRLNFERRDGSEYWIAVDIYEPTDDRRYELRLQPN